MSNDYPDHLYYNNTYFFGPYLHHGRVDPKFIKDLLAIGEKSQDMIDMKKNLAGDLKGEWKFSEEDQRWFCKHMRLNFEHYMKQRASWHADPELEKRGYIIDNVWINYQHPGDYQPEHIHAGDFSWVIYLQNPPGLEEERDNHDTRGPAPGTITFSYGEGVGMTIENYAVINQNFANKVGDFFIFPAQLRHSVPQFKSDGVRISISGNGSFQEKHSPYNDYFYGAQRINN
jgi:hypothetical protein|tara:strand:- start:2792 stop:3481 length:690 start_codon:yes stop_codon:yes gene_type:complete